MPDVQLIAVPNMPLIETGDDLAAILVDALRAAKLDLHEQDIVVITSKIVSKSEGRWVDLFTIEPDEEAELIASECGKDAREVAIILSESTRISRLRPGLLITEHRLGFVAANAGMDHSNARPGDQWRLLLPVDPDRSARDLRQKLGVSFGVTVSVVISDSHGRPFRMGTIGTAIGSAGLPSLWDLRGRPDLFGHRLQVTEVGFADELAAAAGLILGQAAEAVPAVIIRGLSYPLDEVSTSTDLVRPREMDLYR